MLKTALGHRAEIFTELISTVLKRFSLLFLLCICLLWKGSVVFVAIFGFPQGNFHEEESFQGAKLSWEIIHWGNMLELLCEILFMSCFLFSVSILRVELLRVNVRGKFLPVFNCLEDICVGREISPCTRGHIS